jgi:hypothetical protein
MVHDEHGHGLTIFVVFERKQPLPFTGKIIFLTVNNDTLRNKKQILGLQSQGQNLTVQVMLATDHRISYAPAPLLGDLAFLLRYPTPLTHVCTHAMVETKNSPGPVFARMHFTRPIMGWGSHKGYTPLLSADFLAAMTLAVTPEGCHTPFFVHTHMFQGANIFPGPVFARILFVTSPTMGCGNHKDYISLFSVGSSTGITGAATPVGCHTQFWEYILIFLGTMGSVLCLFLIARADIYNIKPSCVRRNLVLLLVVVTMLSSVCAVKGGCKGNAAKNCTHTGGQSDANDIEQEARNALQCNQTQPDATDLGAQEIQPAVDPTAGGRSNRSSEHNDLETWIAAQIARVRNPPPLDPDEDHERQALQLSQDAKTRVALCMVEGNQGGSNVVHAIMRHNEALALMQAAHNMQLYDSEQTETDVTAHQGPKSYSAAAKTKKNQPPPSLVYNNTPVLVRMYNNTEAFNNARRYSENLFRTSVTPMSPLDWQLPSNESVRSRCSAALGMYMLGPHLWGPGRLVTEHPQCPYAWEDIMSSDSAVSQQVSNNPTFLTIVVSGIPWRSVRGAVTTAIDVNQRLVSLDTRPHEMHTVLSSTRAVYSRWNPNSPVQTIHATVRVNNTPRVWRLLAGEAA